MPASPHMLSADSLVSATPDSAPAGAALHERDKVRGLFTAAQGGSASQLTEAAQHFQGQDLNRVRDGRGRTALHFAAQSGRADACKYLLDFFQVDPNSRAEDGELLTRFLVVNFCCYRAACSSSMMTSSCRHCLTAVVCDQAASDLNLTCAGDTPLGLAAAAGHLDVCRLLSEQGAQVHAQGHPEPLHRAAASGVQGVFLLSITVATGTLAHCFKSASYPCLGQHAQHIADQKSHEKATCAHGCCMRALGVTPPLSSTVEPVCKLCMAE